MIRSCCSTCAEMIRIVEELVRYSNHPKAEKMLEVLSEAMTDVNPVIVTKDTYGRMYRSDLPVVPDAPLEKIAYDTEFMP